MWTLNVLTAEAEVISWPIYDGTFVIPNQTAAVFVRRAGTILHTEGFARTSSLWHNINRNLPCDLHRRDRTPYAPHGDLRDKGSGLEWKERTKLWTRRMEQEMVLDNGRSAH